MGLACGSLGRARKVPRGSARHVGSDAQAGERPRAGRARQLWSHRRGSTATATSACSPPTHPCAPQLLPSRWPPRRHRRHHRPSHPAPNRPTAARPAMPGHCCSPAFMKFSRSCARPVAARCASSPSSPTPPPCATSSPAWRADGTTQDRARPGPANVGGSRCRVRGPAPARGPVGPA